MHTKPTREFFSNTGRDTVMSAIPLSKPRQDLHGRRMHVSQIAHYQRWAGTRSSSRRRANLLLLWPFPLIRRLCQPIILSQGALLIRNSLACDGAQPCRIKALHPSCSSLPDVNWYLLLTGLSRHVTSTRGREAAI